MNQFIKKMPCSIPLLFMLVYGILILALVPNYSPNSFFFSRVIGLIAFINVFTLVMLGVFRKFFKTYYNHALIDKIHNILGIVTLILVYIHVLIIGLPIWFNDRFLMNIGIISSNIALVLITLTVISCDLKFYFHIKINSKTWRWIHYLNYAIFPLLLIHELMFGLVSRNYIALGVLIACLGFVIAGIIYKVKRISQKK